MAESNSDKSKNMKAVDKAAMGKTAAKTTEKGAHGGGNKYNQMKLSKGFAVHDAAPKMNKKPPAKGGEKK